jgi:DNA polymerase-3 subunit epsilon
LQADVPAQARKLIAMSPLYLDTETTGLGPQAEIIEISIVNDQGAVLYDSLVRPFGESNMMPSVHGISKKMVAGAPSWNEVWPSVEALLTDRLVGIYNREFDLRMMKQSHKRHWLPWRLEDANFFCIMEMYARFRGDWDPRKGGYRWHSLETAGILSNIHLPNTHRASDDARLARALLYFIAGMPMRSTREGS